MARVHSGKRNSGKMEKGPAAAGTYYLRLDAICDRSKHSPASTCVCHTMRPASKRDVRKHRTTMGRSGQRTRVVDYNMKLIPCRCGIKTSQGTVPVNMKSICGLTRNNPNEVSCPAAECYEDERCVENQIKCYRTTLIVIFHVQSSLIWSLVRRCTDIGSQPRFVYVKSQKSQQP